MADRFPDIFANHPPAWSRPGHSVIDALGAAAKAAAEGSVAHVLVLPLLDPQVKIIARDLDNNVVFYTECAGPDAAAILANLGVRDASQDITELVDTFRASGMDLLAAAQAAAVLNADARASGAL